jgi:hypothetical protein
MSQSNTEYRSLPVADRNDCKKRAPLRATAAAIAAFRPGPLGNSSLNACRRAR